MTEVIELPMPHYGYRGPDDIGYPEPEWEIDPPDGFDDTPDEHHCAVGAECSTDGKGRVIGWWLYEDDNGHGRMRWETPFLVDGRLVVCEDCANAIDAGDLILVDGIWKWVMQ